MWIKSLVLGSFNIEVECIEYFSNGEKISCAFQVEDFVLGRGTKTGVVQRIMRVLVTKDKNKRWSQ